jgi:uncharacterized membrane protein YphA (DoxX/SURF4 family)
VRAALVVLRIFWGLVYFADGMAKFYPGIVHLPGGLQLIGQNSARLILMEEALRNPFQLYHSFVFGMVLPNWHFFINLEAGLEVLAGGLLILGLATRLGALLAALIALHLQFLSMFDGVWVFEYAVQWVTLLSLAFMQAGRSFGLDGVTGNRRFA